MTERATAPVDQHLVETTVRSEQVWRGGFLDVRRDVAALPDGTEVRREYIVHPGAVVIVPLLDDGRLLLERQYRYPLKQVLLEFPAGKIDPGEATFETARRELREETGYRAAEWALAGRLHNAAAYSDEFIEIWFARGLVAGAKSLDPGELIDLCTLSAADLHAAARSGALTDAKTLIGLYWHGQMATGAWQPQWQRHPVDAS